MRPAPPVARTVAGAVKAATSPPGWSCAQARYAAAAPLPVDDQVEGEVVREGGDPLLRLRRLQQGPHQLAAGPVVGVGHAVGGVAALAAEAETAVPRPGEPHPQGDEVPHPSGALPDHGLHHLGVAQAGPGLQGVADVGLGRVPRAESGGDAPWAKRVFESAAPFLVTTATLAPERAARMAK